MITGAEHRAASLLADAWAPALAASYDLGHQHGVATGYRTAERDMQQAWSAMVTDVRRVGRLPTAKETAARRTPTFDPCRQECGRCSRCVCAEARAARGGRDYLGAEREAELARGAA